MTPRWMQSAYLVLALVVAGFWATELPGRKAKAAAAKQKTKGPAKVGKAAPHLQLRTPKGEQITLKHYRNQWVLLNFWATWCAPCRAEMPSMERLARQMRQRQFVLLAASVDSSWRIIRRFFQTHPSLRSHTLKMRLLWDQDHVNARRYGTTKFPETYLIDPHGRVRHKFIGPKKWDSPKMLAKLKQIMR